VGRVSPPPPPGAPPPQGRPSRSRWVPLIAAAIVLLGGATAAAIVLTKHDDHSSDTASAGTAGVPSEPGEFDESELEEEEFEAADEFEEEEEFEEAESPPPSPSQLAQRQIQRALSAHFNRLAAGHYETAYSDLTPSEGESIGGESGWVEAQEEDQLENFSLTVETSLYDPHSAQATIVEFETNALATGCNDWSGYWEMSKVYGEWLISEAKLEKEPC
jgi:hypothetical protein